MTLWDTLTVLPRRWYILLLGLLCTAVAIVGINQREPVYYSRTSVYFLAPASELYPNVLRTTSLDIVATAGVVAKLINGTELQTKVASSEVTLVGRGVRDGSSISLPDNGGQWSISYNVQALDVQVVAPSEERVRQRQAEIIDEIQQRLAVIQADAKVQPADLITTEILPPGAQVFQYRGQPRLAQAMTAALGALLTMLTVGLVELRSRRRLAAASTAASTPQEQPDAPA